MALVPPKQLHLATVPHPLSVRRCVRFEGRRGAPCSSRLDGVGVGALGGVRHGLDIALLHEGHEERAALLLLRQGRRARESGWELWRRTGPRRARQPPKSRGVRGVGAGTGGGGGRTMRMRWTTMLTVSSRTTARTPRVMTRPTCSESNSSVAGGGLGGMRTVQLVGSGLRKSATRGETMPVAKRVNVWYVRRMGTCVACASRVHWHGASLAPTRAQLQPKPRCLRESLSTRARG